MLIRQLHAIMGVLLLTVCLGCGSGVDFERVAASGTVNVNGSPVEEGRIAFLPMEETPGPATGAMIVNGQFSIPEEQGPAVGKHRVEVIAMRPTGQKVAQGSGSENPNALVDEVEQYIPEKYNRNSELSAEITPKTAEQLTFDLEVPN